jgi:superfamily II RNA helicase
VYVQMTEKRPVPLQHFIIYKDALHLIKDEFGVVKRDTIEKVLAMHQKDAKAKYAMDDKAKKKEAQAAEQEGEYKEKKEIDFKEKALKAKENALKKVAHNAVKNQGGKGGDGPNSQRPSNNFKKFTDTIRTVAKEGLLPCVVFCFSKQ